MNTMLGNYQLSGADVAEMGEAAQAFHAARARYERERIREEFMGLGLEAWRQWNDEHPHVHLDEVTDDDIESAAASLSAPKQRDFPALLAFVFGLVIATAVWVSVLIDLARVRH